MSRGVGIRATNFIQFHRPSIGEEEIAAVLETLRSGWLTSGPQSTAFEEEFAEFLGVRHAIAVNSCTAGLHLALEACGIGQGDRVVTTPFTFTASAEVIRYLGADPLFVDIEPDTLNIDPSLVETTLESSDGVRLIMPVHMAGLSCAMESLRRTAEQSGVYTIEDAAHAIPATHGGKNVGALGDAAVFSFYVTKPLAVGEGGMVVTDDDRIAARTRTMRLHGIDRDVFDRYTSTKPSWYYEVVAPGFKYNLPDMAAAIGRVQLKRQHEFRDARREIARRYSEAFADLPARVPPSGPEGDLHAWHLYVLQLELDRLTIDRDRFIELMAEAGVGTSVHFIPLHLQPYWRDRYDLKPEDYPAATAAYHRVVSLPIYPSMDDAAINRVIEVVTGILSKHER